MTDGVFFVFDIKTLKKHMYIDVFLFMNLKNNFIIK